MTGNSVITYLFQASPRASSPPTCHNNAPPEKLRAVGTKDSASYNTSQEESSKDKDECTGSSALVANAGGSCSIINVQLIPRNEYGTMVPEDRREGESPTQWSLLIWLWGKFQLDPKSDDQFNCMYISQIHQPGTWRCIYTAVTTACTDKTHTKLTSLGAGDRLAIVTGSSAWANWASNK